MLTHLTLGDLELNCSSSLNVKSDGGITICDLVIVFNNNIFPNSTPFAAKKKSLNKNDIEFDLSRGHSRLNLMEQMDSPDLQQMDFISS